MTRRSLVIGMCLSTSLLVGPAQGARAGPPTQPTPRWVNDATLDLKAEVAAAADHGVEELLSDRQLRVGPATEEHHVRRAIRIASPSGVEAPSEVAFDFDPTFERLALHHVRIIRGPRTIDALQRADWKVIQPESDRDKRIYDGELEGLLFLYDVRVGDVVDYAYSITGQSAVSRGHYAERLYLAEGPRVAWLRRRIVIDESRPLLMKLHDATPAVESSVSDQRVYAWERHDVPAIDREDDLPSWYIPLPWVDVSDFASWSDVAKARATLFPRDVAPSEEMTALISRWKTAFASDDERALAATTFVQDEIRYLGIEMGPHSHEPFAPAVVLERRFGDCAPTCNEFAATIASSPWRSPYARLVGTIHPDECSQTRYKYILCAQCLDLSCHLTSKGATESAAGQALALVPSQPPRSGFVPGHRQAG